MYQSISPSNKFTDNVGLFKEIRGAVLPGISKRQITDGVYNV